MKDNCLGQMSSVGDFIWYSKSMGGRAEQGEGGERNGNFSWKEAQSKGREGQTRVLISLGDNQVYCSLDYWGLYKEAGGFSHSS